VANQGNLPFALVKAVPELCLNCACALTINVFNIFNMIMA